MGCIGEMYREIPKSIRGILFLDFDGVTHPEICRDLEYFCNVETILAAIKSEELTPDEFGIVLSTSWIYSHKFDIMEDFLGPELMKYVLGANSEFYPGHEGVITEPNIRYRECRVFLEKNGLLHRDVKWVALDDMKGHFPVDCEELIHCNKKFGVSADSDALLKFKYWLRGV